MCRRRRRRRRRRRPTTSSLWYHCSVFCRVCVEKPHQPSFESQSSKTPPAPTTMCTAAPPPAVVSCLVHLFLRPRGKCVTAIITTVQITRPFFALVNVGVGGFTWSAKTTHARRVMRRGALKCHCCESQSRSRNGKTDLAFGVAGSRRCLRARPSARRRNGRSKLPLAHQNARHTTSSSSIRVIHTGLHQTLASTQPADEPSPSSKKRKLRRTCRRSCLVLLIRACSRAFSARKSCITT